MSFTKIFIPLKAVLYSESFLGFEITNLYDFFMLFIVMTGVAATILFLLSSWLQKMMHNDHVEGVDLSSVENR